MDSAYDAVPSTEKDNVEADDKLTNAGAPGRNRDADAPCPGDHHASGCPHRQRTGGSRALRSSECTPPLRGSPPRRPIPAARPDPASLILSGRASAQPFLCSHQPHLPLSYAVDRWIGPSIHRWAVDRSTPHLSLSWLIDPSTAYRSLYRPSIDLQPIDRSTAHRSLFCAIDR